MGFSGGSDGKESACNAGDPGLIPELGRSSGEWNGNPLQYSCLQSPMDSGALWTIVLGVEKSQTQLTDWQQHLLSQFSSVAQSCLTLWPRELQHTRPPTPGAYPNPCPLSRWCHPTISPSIIPFSHLQSFPSIKVFSNESVPCIRWPKYWSLSFSLSLSNEYSNEYSGLISFRIGWFDLLSVQGTLGSLLQLYS